jgi:hypothetical protein
LERKRDRKTGKDRFEEKYRDAERQINRKGPI